MLKGLADPRLLDAGVLGAAFAMLLWTGPDLTFYLLSPDHGSHLSIARELLLGRFPFVDVFYHYGPLDGFTVAAGLWATGSLLGETVLCAACYALALWLVFVLVRRASSPAFGVAAAIAAFLFLARFHKWYYWLFPLLSLYCLARGLERPSRWRALVAGLAAGIAVLYRLDLGVACLCAHWTAWMAITRAEHRRVAPHGLAYVVGLLAAPGLWCSLLVRHGGTSAVVDYARATIDGAFSVVARRSLPFPAVDWSNPLGAESGTALAYVLVPVGYAAAIVCGWRGLRRTSGAASPRALLATGVFGLAILPQGLHRKDAQHLLQVLPPAIVVAALLGARWRAAPHPRWQHVGGCVLAGVVAIAGVGLARNGRCDLVGARTPMAEKYRDLDRAVLPTDGALGALVGMVQAETAPDDRILVVTLQWQLPYFVERPVSGYVPAYALGHLDDRGWRRRNLDAIRRHPPRAVIASDELGSGADPEFRASQPELWRYLARRYTRVAGRVDGNVILVREGVHLARSRSKKRAARPPRAQTAQVSPPM